jgi:enoyl-CoA hydratase/carnithine racemase
MRYETLIAERRGHVGWLIFNRPEVLNAFNLLMAQELARLGATAAAPHLTARKKENRPGSFSQSQPERPG